MNTYFVSKTRKRKYIGQLIGHVYGFETKKELTDIPELIKGSILILTNGERVEIDTFELYKVARKPTSL